MNISVIGSGSVGTSLATGLAEAGHTVTLGTRDPGRAAIREWLDAAPTSARAATYRDAAESGDLIIMAVPGRLVVDTVEGIGTEVFDGKLVIDPSNPVVFDDAEVRSAFGPDDSAAEALQRALPGARVVKAFNQIEAAQMTHPAPDEKRPVRIAGDDEEAKAEVASLLESLGWTVRDLGSLSRAQALESGVIDWMAKNQAE